MFVPIAGAVLLLAGAPSDFDAVPQGDPVQVEAPVFVDLPAGPEAAASPPEQAPRPDDTVPAAPPPPAPGDAQPGGIVVTGRGAPPPGDPLQQLNAESFRIAQSVDEAVVEPVAKGYRGIVPEPVRDGLGNALRNLGEPVNFLNFLLQLKFGKAAETVGRFAVNSTLGVAGLFDVAKKKPFNLPYRPNGLANTLGYYGVKPGPYFFIPIVGSTTLRDMVGDTIDLMVLPFSVGKPFNRPAFAIPATVIDKLNDRLARDSEIRHLREESPDPYVETRTLYLDMRQREIDALKGKTHAAPVVVPAVPVTDNTSATGTPPAVDAPVTGLPASPPPVDTSRPSGADPLQPDATVPLMDR
jgi:phospholipid-binding lipoprotein MlaA